MIRRIIEEDKILDYLKGRRLIDQYRKAKRYILEGNLKTVSFKKRRLKTSKIYQFRINNQYRAFGYYDQYNNTTFRVIEISDHQEF